LLVKGLVETGERKAELLAALAPVARHPTVEIKVLTVAEALARDNRINSNRSLLPERQAEITASITNGAMPVEAELCQRFASRGFSGRRLE
jgi:hypothetical protein